jgi:hypothetical protein
MESETRGRIHVSQLKATDEPIAAGSEQWVTPARG